MTPAPGGRDASRAPIVRLYRALFRLWMPREIRAEVGEPALAAFEDLWAEARASRGKRAAVRLLARELASLARTGWRERFGGGGPVERPSRRRAGWITDLLGDLRLGARALRRRPGFAAVALLTVALGVGLNTAIFSLADAVFLRPLAYPASERLGLLSTERVVDSSGFSVSYLELRDVEERNRVFEELAFFLDWRSVNLSGGDRPERIAVNFVTADYFGLLGFQPLLGSLFAPGDDGEGPLEPVAVLSYGLWRQRFGGDAEVVGRSVVLDGMTFAVVGVLSPEVSDLGQRFGQRPDAYLPLTWAEPLLQQSIRERRGARYLTGVVRWRAGITEQDVRDDLDRISTELAGEHPESNRGWRLVMRPVSALMFEHAREATLVLLAGAGLVLLLVCANLAGLLLIQGTERSGELAMRRALGAGRERVVRQLVTESLLLGLVGGALGIGVAFLGVRLLASTDALRLPTFVSLALDRRALAAAVAISLLTGVLVGVTPALRAGRVEALACLRGGRSLVGGGGARAAMLSAQVALAVVLMAGAVLLVDSLRQLQATELGFDDQRLITARLDLQGERYDDPEALRAVADALLERARALPGVEDALLWGPSRLGGGNWVRFVTREGRYDRIDERIEASRHHLLPGALAALGVPILRGRDLSSADRPGAPPVALVSEALARVLWPDRDPVGQRLATSIDGEVVAVEVVGVTGNAKHRMRVDDFLSADFDVYFAYRQEPERHLNLLLRFASAAGADRAAESAVVSRIVPALRGAIGRIDLDLPIYQVGTLREQLAEEEARSRLSAALVSSYALLAMALASLGIYGALALAVRQRAREIGLRLALGASRADILEHVLGQGMRVLVAGAALGVAGAYGVSRLLGSTLYGATSLDLGRLLLVIAGLAAMAILGVTLPARQASRIEPTAALQDG
jgi:putative ABC transport system permease protein